MMTSCVWTVSWGIFHAMSEGMFLWHGYFSMMSPLGRLVTTTTTMTTRMLQNASVCFGNVSWTISRNVQCNRCWKFVPWNISVNISGNTCVWCARCWRMPKSVSTCSLPNSLIKTISSVIGSSTLLTTSNLIWLIYRENWEWEFIKIWWHMC